MAAVAWKKQRDQQKTKRIDLTPTGLLMEGHSAHRPVSGFFNLPCSACFAQGSVRHAKAPLPLNR